MSDQARDRILHLALRQTLGNVQPPDVRELVLTAIRDGRIDGRRAWPVRRRILAAAAAILLVAIPAWLLMPETRPPIAARSDGPVTVVSADRTSRTDDRIAAGETVVVPAAGRLTFVSGTEVHAVEESRIAIGMPDGRPQVRMQTGRIMVRSPAGAALEILTDGGDVTPAANSELEVAQSPVPSLTTHRGSATLARAGRKWTVEPGQFVGMSRGDPPTIVPLPGKEERLRVDSLLADTLQPLEKRDFKDPAVREAFKRRSIAMVSLRASVDGGDTSGAYAIAILAHLPHDPAQKGMRRMVLELLLRDPEGRATGVVARAVAREPDALGAMELIAAVEAGIPDAEPLLLSRYEGKMNLFDRRLVAALLAFRGDRRGRDVLRDSLNDFRRFIVEDRLLAAAALHRMGETAFWTNEVDGLAGRVEKALDMGLLDMARTTVLRIAYFHRGLEAGGSMPIAYLPDRLRSFQRQRAKFLRTAEDIRRLLAVFTE